MQSGEFDGISAETLLAILNHLKIRFVPEQELMVLTRPRLNGQSICKS
jgi:hypothetical protein